MTADPFLDSAPGGARPPRIGDVVCLYEGGPPMAVTRLWGDGDGTPASADVAWHEDGGMLFTARFPLAALHPYVALWIHPDAAHDRAVQLAEAGATKVTFGTGWGPLIFFAGVFMGFLLAVARGALS